MSQLIIVFTLQVCGISMRHTAPGEEVEGRGISMWLS